MLTENFIKQVNRYLVESPFYNDEDYEPSAKETDIVTTYSASTLGDKFEKISDVDTILGNFEIWVSDDKIKKGSYIVVALVDSETPGYKQCVSFLNLIKKPNVRVKGLTNYFQVKLVNTTTDYRQSGIALKLYLAVLSQGHSIISDDEQYKGAKSTWKKLTKMSKEFNIKVKVWDNVNGKYLKGKDGSEVYDGENIPDSTIWNKDVYSYGMLLTLED